MVFLILDRNPIETLPEKFEQLKSLKHLCLSRNSHLKSLPEGIINLLSLEELDLAGTFFPAFHKETRQVIETLRERGCLVKDY